MTKSADPDQTAPESTLFPQASLSGMQRKVVIHEKLNGSSLDLSHNINMPLNPNPFKPHFNIHVVKLRFTWVFLIHALKYR